MICTSDGGGGSQVNEKSTELVKLAQLVEVSTSFSV